MTKSVMTDQSDLVSVGFLTFWTFKWFLLRNEGVESTVVVTKNMILQVGVILADCVAFEADRAVDIGMLLHCTLMGLL